MSKTTIFQARLRDFASVDGGGLNLTVKSGRIRDDNTVTDKTDQTVALTDDNTNFVELNNLGVASANTSAFTSGSTPISQVVTASGSITTITDKRAWAVGGLAASLLTSQTEDFTRTAAAGSGDQSITGIGFKPRAVIVVSVVSPPQDSHSVGYADSDAKTFVLPNSSLSFGFAPNFFISVTDGATGGMDATLKSLDSDGFTVTWVKSNAGLTINSFALCLR